MDSKVIYDVFYLLAAILFILGVKLMAHPRTARRGNMFGILGMTIAIVISILSANEQLVYQKPFTLFVIGLCCLIGILFGGILATRVKMTEMPQLVAVFNGIGGLASVLVAGAALVVAINISVDEKLATGLSGFSSSPVAFPELLSVSDSLELDSISPSGWYLLWYALTHFGTRP